MQEENNKEEEDDGLDDVDWRKMDSSGQRLILVTLTFSQSDSCSFLRGGDSSVVRALDS